ncbi:MAG: DNA polymerase ligase N-terminal domain-containing protein [Parachlamydiales bacterium]|jgi:DNA ligase D-like protein (predicted 3'-phosphoesterase)
MNSLEKYKKRRDFKKTKEPGPKTGKTDGKIFVLQKHSATHLHFDFRIQIGKVLKSWAVPKGLPKTSNVKRLAILTEDHPLEYANFEGTIPEGEYGAGFVEIVDRGSFDNIKKDKDGKEISLNKCFKNGTIEIFLHGKKINGIYALIKFKDDKSWLLIKVNKNKYERKI